MATGRLSAVWKDNCVLCWVLFFMSGLCWLLSCSVIIQHGLSCRANAAWDYSASPLKPETRDAGECARNVLIALCEECPSADSSSDFISGVWDWYFRRGRGRAREKETEQVSKEERNLDAAMHWRIGSMSFLIFFGLISENLSKHNCPGS